MAPTATVIDEWMQDYKVEEVNVETNDLSINCKDCLYELGLYAISGAHFFIGGTVLDRTKKNEDSDMECPSVIAFASIGGIKKFFQVNEDMDDKLSKYSLGEFALSDILSAEKKANAIDDTKYNLSKNTCVHYARDIWRSLGVKETQEMADFLITNLAGRDEFIEFAKKKHGGLHAVMSFAIGGKRYLENYVRTIVTSQLSIEATGPEKEKR